MKIIKKLFFLIVFNLLIFQDYLQTRITAMQYFDEIVAYIFIFFAIITILVNKYKLSLQEFKVIFVILLILVVGIIGNFVYKNQSIKYALLDFLLMFKFAFAYFVGRFLFNNISIFHLKKVINTEAQIIVVLLSVLILSNLVLNFFPIAEVRYGFPVQQLFFSHPTYLASFCTNLLMFLTLFAKYYRVNSLFILVDLLIIASSLRAKALAFVFIYVSVWIIITMKRKIRIGNIIGIISFIVILFIPVIKEKILAHQDFARFLLYKYSLVIAKSNFPLGSGFGSFASFVSGKYYSPLYYYYGLNNTYGLSPDRYNFISDTFWPMIIGQLGFFGLLLFAYLIFIFLSMIYKRTKGNMHFRLAAFIPMLYLLISSTSESSFANPIAVSFFLVLGVILSDKSMKYFAKNEVQLYSK